MCCLKQKVHSADRRELKELALVEFPTRRIGEFHFARRTYDAPVLGGSFPRQRLLMPERSREPLETAWLEFFWVCHWDKQDFLFDRGALRYCFGEVSRGRPEESEHEGSFCDG